MSKAPPQKSPADIVREWLSTQKILIADSNRASRNGVCKLITEMGGKIANISFAEQFEPAINLIQEHQPGFVVTDFDFAKGSGLNLLQEQRANNAASKKSVFVIVTGNTSQSAVAQAAEEDVDTFILKPYTLEIFRQCLYKAILNKINPTPYMLAIEEGKELLFAAKPDEALAVFKKAEGLNPKPSLACFYSGQAEMLKKLIDNAESEYKKGLAYQKIHYKCMVGLFDSLMERKDYNGAYEVVKKISLYFPANPKRLATIIRLAVQNRKIEDMEKYHQVFMSLDTRSPELTNYICAGLIVCAKYYLKNNFSSRGLELFKKAAISSGNSTKFLRQIIFALVETRNYPEVDQYLSRFPSDTRGTADYLASSLLLCSKVGTPSETLTRGRAALKDQPNDPAIYEIVIEAAAQANVKDFAQNLCEEASKKWPKLAAQFSKALTAQQKAA